ncbi:putative ABC transporter permease [Candidatus Enterococcus clewellii]|uniref:ABC transporter permease n=1 Tax=Candidatus Enterococcus clewellii TaxID=1834193 RepID=A0A242K3J4_9ENTE|nr:hypothetical protein [Enterococcus sp. 9E7_DIV0242]OTP13567.1 hypothetical protein A5888_003045 [Enterococcus sp. 9E7_DIV0242]
MDQWSELILLFFIYSFIGWVWETIYCSINAGRFVYRGFLTGPYCPIYGFGILGVLYFLEPLKNNLVLLYFSSAVLVSVLEYLTSYALEKMFHASWWDYKDVPLNLNGRIALPVSAFWGIACVLIVKVIHPRIQVVSEYLVNQFHWVLPTLLSVILLVDLVYTVTNMQAFQRITKEVNDLLETRAKELSENVTERSETLKAEWEEWKQTLEQEIGERTAKQQAFLDELKSNSAVSQRLQRLNFSQRRWIKNYPKLSLRGLENPESVKRLVTSFKEKRKKM